jgi:hypothetical protein
MKRPNKKDYDLNDHFEAIRLARDLIKYIDYLELEKQTNQEQKLHVDLVMLTPDAIAKHLEWDSYYHMMINGEHIDHQLKEAINMLFFTNKLEVPFG